MIIAGPALGDRHLGRLICELLATGMPILAEAGSPADMITKHGFSSHPQGNPEKTNPDKTSGVVPNPSTEPPKNRNTGSGAMNETASDQKITPHPSRLISGFDQFLRSQEIRTQLKPDLIILAGAHPATKSLELYLGDHTGIPQIHFTGRKQLKKTKSRNHHLLVVPRGAKISISALTPATDPVWQQTWNEISDRALQRRAQILADWRAGEAFFLNETGQAGESSQTIKTDKTQLTGQTSRRNQRKHSGESIEDLKTAHSGHTTQTGPTPAGDSKNSTQPRLTDGEIYGILNEYIETTPATLMVGNSFPARDATLFGMPGLARNRIFMNRGASGIDGNISTATGLSVSGPGETILVLGDLAFLHDLNALLASGPGVFGRMDTFPMPSANNPGDESHKSSDKNGNTFRGSKDSETESGVRSMPPSGQPRLTVMVVNNRGGQIFRMLPISTSPWFSEFFETPQQADIPALCRGFGVPAESVSDQNSLKSVLTAGNPGGIRVIEVRTDPAASMELRQKIWNSFDEVAS